MKNKKTVKEENMKLNINLPIEIYRKSKRRFVSKCPLLTIFSGGNTEREAKENLRNIINIYLETCVSTRRIGLMLENETNYYNDSLDEYNVLKTAI